MHFANQRPAKRDGLEGKRGRKERDRKETERERA